LIDMRTGSISLLLLALACSHAPPKRVRDLLGGGTIAEGDARVTAYRIDGFARSSGADKSLHGYPVLAGPVDVDETAREILHDVLLDDDTYLWEIEKACEFLPGVLLRYEGEQTVDVLFCFSCDELEVYRGDTKTGHEDFDPRRADLVRVAKRLFPGDPAIAKLEP
jgi:hypothetical protein